MTEGMMKNSTRHEIATHARSTTPAASKSSRLYHRLEEALNSGSEVWFRMPGTRLVGIPIYLDADYVEVVDVDVAEGFEDEELPDEPYQRTVWLVRLEEISAISYATDRWSKERFERLLEQSYKEAAHREEKEDKREEKREEKEEKEDKSAE